MNTKDIPRSIEQCHDEYSINKQNWKLKGWSRAGCQTGFILYPFKILIDCGLHSSQNFDHIFLTHQHTDHTQNLTALCNRHKPARNNIYAPSSSIKYLTKLVRAMSELCDPKLEELSDEDLLIYENIHFHGVNYQDVVILDDLKVEILQAYHSCQTVGFGFYSYRQVIRDEYRELVHLPHEEELYHLSAQERLEQHHIKEEKIAAIKQLRANGVEMYNHVYQPEFCFYCDSNVHNLLDHTEWLQYPVVVVECTGLAGNHEGRDFDRDYHTSMDCLEPILLAHRDKRWVLVHVTSSLTIEEIEMIERRLRREGLDIFIFKR